MNIILLILVNFFSLLQASSRMGKEEIRRLENLWHVDWMLLGYQSGIDQGTLTVCDWVKMVICVVVRVGVCCDVCVKMWGGVQVGWWWQWGCATARGCWLWGRWGSEEGRVRDWRRCEEGIKPHPLEEPGCLPCKRHETVYRLRGVLIGMCPDISCPDIRGVLMREVSWLGCVLVLVVLI